MGLYHCYSNSFHRRLKREWLRSLKQVSSLSVSSFSERSLSPPFILWHSTRCVSTAGSSPFAPSSRTFFDKRAASFASSKQKEKQQRHGTPSNVRSTSSPSLSSSSSEEKILTDVFSSFSLGGGEELTPQHGSEREYSSTTMPTLHPKPFVMDKFLSIQSRTIDQLVQIRKEFLDRYRKLLRGRKEQLQRFYSSWSEFEKKEGSSASRPLSLEPPSPPPLSLALSQELEVLEKKLVGLEEHQGFTLPDELIYHHFYVLIELGVYGPALQWLEERIVSPSRLGPSFPPVVLDGLLAIAKHVRPLFPDASSAGLRVPMAAPVTSVSGRESLGGYSTDLHQSLSYPTSSSSTSLPSSSPPPVTDRPTTPFDVTLAHPIHTTVVQRAQAMSSLLSRAAASAMPLQGSAGYLDQLQQLSDFFMNRSRTSSSSFSIASCESASSSPPFLSAMEHTTEGMEGYVEDLSLASQTLQPPNPFFYALSKNDAALSPDGSRSLSYSAHSSLDVDSRADVVGVPPSNRWTPPIPQEGHHKEETAEVHPTELVDTLLGVRQLASFFLHRGEGGSGAVHNLSPLPSSASLFEQRINSPSRFPPPPPPLHPSYTHHLILVYVMPLLHVLEECGFLFDQVSPLRRGREEEDDENDANDANDEDEKETRREGVWPSSGSSSSAMSHDVLSSFIPAGFSPSQASAVRRVRQLFASSAGKFDPLLSEEVEEEKGKEKEVGEGERAKALDEEEARVSSSTAALATFQKVLELYASVVELVCESKEPTLLVLLQSSILAGFFHLERREECGVPLPSFPSCTTDRNGVEGTARSSHRQSTVSACTPGTENTENESCGVVVPVISEAIWLEDISLGLSLEDVAVEMQNENECQGSDTPIKNKNSIQKEEEEEEGEEEDTVPHSRDVSSHRSANALAHQQRHPSRMACGEASRRAIHQNIEAGRFLLHHFLQETFLQFSTARQSIFTEKVCVWRTVDMLHSFGALHTLWHMKSNAMAHRHRSSPPPHTTWCTDAPEQEKGSDPQPTGERETTPSSHAAVGLSPVSFLSPLEAAASRISMPSLCRAFQCWHYEWARTEVGLWVPQHSASLARTVEEDLSTMEGDAGTTATPNARGAVQKRSWWQLHGSPAVSCSYLPLFTRPSSYYPFLYGNPHPTTAPSSSPYSKKTNVTPPVVPDAAGSSPSAFSSVEGDEKEAEAMTKPQEEEAEEATKNTMQEEVHLPPLPVLPRQDVTPSPPMTSGGRVQPAHHCWHTLWHDVDLAARRIVQVYANAANETSPSTAASDATDHARETLEENRAWASPSPHSTDTDASFFRARGLAGWRRTAGVVLDLMAAPTSLSTSPLHLGNCSFRPFPSETRGAIVAHVEEEEHPPIMDRDKGLPDAQTVEMLLINRHWQEELQKCLLLQQSPAHPRSCASVSMPSNAFPSLPRCYSSLVYEAVVRCRFPSASCAAASQEGGAPADLSSTSVASPTTTSPMPSTCQRALQWEALLERALLGLSLDLHHILRTVPYFPAFFRDVPASAERVEEATEEGSEGSAAHPSSTMTEEKEEACPRPLHGDDGMYFQEEAFQDMGEEEEEGKAEDGKVGPEGNTEENGFPHDTAHDAMVDPMDHHSPPPSFPSSFSSSGKAEGVWGDHADLSAIGTEEAMALERPSLSSTTSTSLPPFRHMDDETHAENRGPLLSSSSSLPSRPSSWKAHSATLNYLCRLFPVTFSPSFRDEKKKREENTEEVPFSDTPLVVEEACHVFLLTVEHLILLLPHTVPSRSSLDSLPRSLSTREENPKEGRLRDAPDVTRPSPPLVDQEEEEMPRTVSPAAFSSLALLLEACDWVRGEASSTPSSANAPCPPCRPSSALLRSLLWSLFPLSTWMKTTREDVPASSLPTFSSSEEKIRPPHVSALSPWHPSFTTTAPLLNPESNNGNAVALMVLTAARAGLWEEVELLLSSMFRSSASPDGREGDDDTMGLRSFFSHPCSAVQMDPSILVAIFLEARKAGVPSVCLLLRKHRENLFFS